MGGISERRIEKLINPALSGLPPFLTAQGGLHSGLMIVQVSAAALASENKTLAHPASVDSIPTSADKEDHVYNGNHRRPERQETSSRMWKISWPWNCCHRPGNGILPSPQTRRGVPGEAYRVVREEVPPIKGDRGSARTFKGFFLSLNREHCSSGWKERWESWNRKGSHRA